MDNTVLKKLRLTQEQDLTILNRPNQDYFAGFQITEEEPQKPVDTIILFVKTLEEMTGEIFNIIKRGALNPNGRLLVAYPKKGNKTFDTYVHRDDILPALHVDEDGYIKDSDYKFNQMIKLDDTYTMVGMKRVKKEEIRKRTSQSVMDYVSYIPELERYLEADQEALAFFQNLTPGYRRSWARYVFSTRRPATQENRKEEMVMLLKKGIKSKELARKEEKASH